MSDGDKSASVSSLLAVVEEIFKNKIAFNQVIGLEISLIGEKGEPDVGVAFAMRPELIGNFTRGVLHGGVICSALDVVGGLAVYAQLGADYAKPDEILSDEDEKALLDRFSKLSTLDLRVDFLRPGRGTHFSATAQVLRIGSRIGVVRMELHNDLDEHIAAATASYSIG